MTALTISDASRRSGLSEPTLRYYEQIGLIGPIGPIGPIARDDESGQRVLAAIDELETIR